MHPSASFSAIADAGGCSAQLDVGVLAGAMLAALALGALALRRRTE
jgi:uncharacterized protein (TIGR03382 family)